MDGFGTRSFNARVRTDLNEAIRIQPKHVRLQSFLRTELTSGRLRAGEPLPTEVHLAKTLRIARSTVRQAMAELERDGLIYRIRGKGTFVRREPDAASDPGVADFALVVPETRADLYASLLHGFEAAAAKVNNHVSVCSTDNDLNKQGNLILQLLRKKVAGVAIVPATAPPTPAYQVLELQERGIPVVFCHRRVQGVRAPLLAIPFDQVGQLAGQAFLKQGHRRAAFIAVLRSEATLRYEAGLREAMRNGGGDLPEEFVYMGPTTSPDVAEQEETVFQVLRHMCDNPDPPTAIFTGGDPMAELVYLLLGRMELRVPEDISVVGFGGTHRDGALLARLTSVVVDEADLGRQAVDLLHQMSAGNRPLDDDEVRVMRLSISAGRTLGPTPKERQA